MREAIEKAIKAGFQDIYNLAPYDTGNLHDFGIKTEIGINEAHLYVDEKVAPYMKYTNEPWYNFAPPLFGKENPNEFWFDDAALGAIVYIEDLTRGTLRR